jgi:Uma2 family endonuclease
LIGRHGWRHPGLISLIGHGSEFRFVIPGLGSDRHPDLVVVFRGAELDENGRPRPSLAVEIVSPGSVARKRDYESKREEYLTVGLREYWIVDPKLRQVTVLTYRVEDGIATWAEAVFQGEELIASGLLPGFDGTVAALWLDVD